MTLKLMKLDVEFNMLLDLLLIQNLDFILLLI